ncbi:hypothetical protein HanXRQr2_Chr03g0097021 [Helianthus annuus]|uniref:Uncharacterized protein n=1 Tax=Helianthus annuus TaxID=4232 RepID=A0A251UXL9_HELAN|nr:hypothetical protein HanXRQr2_Chr03g0097021 [Helianthus annuus]KAJ0942568.1 hypothetical protein HanPSC8_Chr03g0093541 [Helianthus annuus]
MKLLIDFLEKSGWSDFLENSFFPSHTSSLQNIFLELMTFQKPNNSISCFKKLSQTCPKILSMSRK